jgi:hypothetical protein
MIWAAVAAIVIFSAGCEELPPTDYKEHSYLEAFLIVGEPIENIRVIGSQPIGAVYSLEDAIIRDAEITIMTEGETIDLAFRDGELPGYYDPQGHIVKPQTKYEIEVNLPGGETISGKTFTPPEFDWIRPPKPYMHFPEDTLKLPSVDSLIIEWEGYDKYPMYLLSVKCLDTLSYGKYLDPPTAEKNRRSWNIMRDQEGMYDEISFWTFMGNTQTYTVWTAFKWFGLHEVSIYRPDYNMLRWFMQYQNFEGDYYNEILSSVEGDGIGCFGSASMVTDTSFLYKNQP